ncbi:MAG: ABC transporter ATP-binding protein [Candidatus Korobacteraceae bacterium]
MNGLDYQLTDIKLHYGNILALDVDNLLISCGRLHILAGPNGAGKSSLLNVMAFLEKPSHGRVLFRQTPVAWEKRELRALRKRVTLLHQRSYLFSGSVSSNVAFGPRVRGLSKEQVRCSVEDSLALVGLVGFESRNAKHLSGGEARRVELARALACKPEVLLLDEPLAYVDRESRVVVEALIVSLVLNGMTVVMASHEEDIAERLDAEIIRLQYGKIERIINRPTALGRTGHR